MRTVFKCAAAVVLLLFCVSCGGNAGNNLITSEGVGRVTFDLEIPDMGKGYVTERDTMYFEDGDGYSCYVVKNKAGERVLNVFTGHSMEVYSPDFKTKAGIHPGMNLLEAIHIAGDENLNMWLGWPNNYFTIEDYSSGFTWNITGDQLIGGWDKFQEFSLEGKSAVFSDFSPEATIGWITVIKE